VDPLLAAQDSTPHLHRTHRQQTNKQTQTQTQVCKKKKKKKKKEESCAELSWGLVVVVVIVVVFELFFSNSCVSVSLVASLSSSSPNIHTLT